jgi:molybdate-binding protein/transcriptional regulator with XRE-family HTH domain
MDSIIPNRLGQLRRQRNWSQQELATRSGVSRAEVSAIETGRNMPSVAVALRLARALDTDVEHVFSADPEATVRWAWEPYADGDGRVWHASVKGRTLTYPVELTAAGVLPHDGWFDGHRTHPRTTAVPEQTLVIAGCDPLVGLVVRELALQHRVRVIPLLRSSRQALDLLRQGLVHLAGIHMTDADGRPRNETAVRGGVGIGYHLLHQVEWQSGVVLDSGRRERSVAGLIRAKVRWVNREEGSAARDTFDTLIGSHRRPEGYERVVHDHRAVATTVASGWADAGVCIRPVAAEAHLGFIPVHQEAYDLVVPDELIDDARVSALMSTLRSTEYRQLLADVPGCSSARTGDVHAVI